MKTLFTLHSAAFVFIGAINTPSFAENYVISPDPLIINTAPQLPDYQPIPSEPAGPSSVRHTLSAGDYLNISIQSEGADKYNLLALEVLESSPWFSGMQVKLYAGQNLLATQSLDWTGYTSLFIDANTPHNLEASNLDFAALAASNLTRIEVHPLFRPQYIDQTTKFSITSLSFGNLTSLNSYVTSANSITYDVQLVSAVPEPSTFLTTMLGLTALAGLCARNRLIFGRVAT